MAYWMDKNKNGYYGGADGYCSSCGEEVGFMEAITDFGTDGERTDTIQYPYCPWCGAEMDIDEFSKGFKKKRCE